MPFYVLKGDLVDMNVDAIVNASNVNLTMVEGVGRAIYHKAGDVELGSACRLIGRCQVGKAVETSSFNMHNCKIIIHAVGPNYINGKHNEKKNLISAYKESLAILDSHGYTSIAFPLLSGEFNYPLREAYNVAFSVFMDYLKENKNNNIFLVMYKNFPQLIDDDLQENLTKFITENFKIEIEEEKKELAKNNVKFVELIRKYQKDLNVSDDELIFKGNLSQKEFDELVNNSLYIPTKNVCYAFSIALKLNIKDTEFLLESLGYKFEKSKYLDLIYLFYTKKGIYDVYQINNALFVYKIKPLGANFNL